MPGVSTGPAIPLRSLLVLGLAVLAAHLWLLRATGGPVRPRSPSAAPVFVTRGIAAPAPRVAELQPVRDLETTRPQAGRPHPSPPAPAKTRLAPPVATEAMVEGVQPVELLPVAAATVAAPHPETAASVAAPPLRFSLPGSARLHYQVTATVRHMQLQGEGELIWRHDASSYDARLEIRTPLLPSRIQHSAGLISAEGLAPVRFSDKARSEEAVHFQRDQGKVTFSNNRPDAPLLAGTQDRLSVMLQLGAMVAGEPRKFPAGTVISVPTAGTREAEPWLFKVEGEEDLHLPGGKVGTLRLTRNPRHEFDQKLELWLAPAMAYVPVRLRLTQPNGDWIDQQWSSTDRR